jgi:hypothetical protein
LFRTSVVGSCIVAGVCGLIGLAAAADTDKDDFKSEPGCVQGAIVKLFKDEQLIELKVERILTKEAAPTPKDDERSDRPRSEGSVKEGEVIFLRVGDARVFDEKGNERTREDKSAWFTKDKGWDSLDEGMRCQVEFTGTQKVPAPRGFPGGARAGGNIIVYHVTELRLLSKSKD